MTAVEPSCTALEFMRELWNVQVRPVDDLPGDRPCLVCNEEPRVVEMRVYTDPPPTSTAWSMAECCRYCGPSVVTEAKDTQIGGSRRPIVVEVSDRLR